MIQFWGNWLKNKLMVICTMNMNCYQQSSLNYRKTIGFSFFGGGGQMVFCISQILVTVYEFSNQKSLFYKGSSLRTM